MKPMKKIYKKFLKNLLITVGSVGIATGIGFAFFKMGLHETNITMMYILSVLMTSRFTSSHLDGIVASILSLLAFNFFFTDPYFSLKVKDLTYFITFFTMAVTAILTSNLTMKYKKAAQEAEKKEQESQVLYQMTNHLTDAEDYDSIVRIVVETVSNLFSCHAGYIYLNESGKPETTFIQQKEEKMQIRRELNEVESLRWTMNNLQSTYSKDGEFYDWPVYGKSEIFGILRIPTETANHFTEQHKNLLHSVIESSSLAMERLHSLKMQAQSREEIAQERYRGNLLRAISHDLRTPLSAIMGSSEVLMQICKDNEHAYEISKGIYQDTNWLYSLVENILSLTRLQQENLSLKKQTEVLEEVVGAAIATMEKRQPNRKIEVNMPENLILVDINASLIHQVLINLLDNAMKHSKMDTKITLNIYEKEKFVYVDVMDEGDGIPEKDLQSVFQMFYTTREKCIDSNRGIGLGLSICQTIVEAHGGKIQANNRTDRKGAIFSFSLPLKEETYEDNIDSGR